MNASDLKRSNLLISEGWGKLKVCTGPYKTAGQSQKLSRQAESLVMYALLKGGSGGGWHRGLGDGSPGAMPCHAGTARIISSWHFEVWTSEAFLLVAVPRGCSCSSPTPALGVRRELLLLCIAGVLENFKTNIFQQHIISCGCPSHEFFTLLCLPSSTLLISDRASFCSLIHWNPG